jgi:8-oxo-dGTP pyrophosphatase MutT (NUDIX family)
MIDIDKILKLAGLLEDDRDHDRTLARTGFWGEQAGGCLFFAQSTGKFLIGYRSGSVLQPHTWGTFGGAIDKGEKPDAAVLREAEEEVGYHGPVKLIPIYVFKKETFRYYNFIAVVPEEFEPRLNWENDDTAWVNFGEWPKPLHFGMNGILGDSASVNTMKKLASSVERPVDESAMRSLINICERPVEPKMPKYLAHSYSITRAQGGGWIVMYNGHELETVETTREAALLVARDMVSGYPEVTPDLMYELLDEFDGNIHDPAFMPALIRELEKDFNNQVKPNLRLVPRSE